MLPLVGTNGDTPSRLCGPDWGHCQLPVISTRGTPEGVGGIASAAEVGGSKDTKASGWASYGLWGRRCMPSVPEEQGQRREKASVQLTMGTERSGVQSGLKARVVESGGTS